MRSSKRFQVWFNRDGTSRLIAWFKSRSEAETFANLESVALFETEGGEFEIIEEGI